MAPSRARVRENDLGEAVPGAKLSANHPLPEVSRFSYKGPNVSSPLLRRRITASRLSKPSCAARCPRALVSPWEDLAEPQREMLAKLVREYLFRHRADVAAEEFANVMTKSGTLHFAWAGGLERGQPHCCRVQGGANHVHSVWRDFDREFGADVLAEQYKAAHGK